MFADIPPCWFCTPLCFPNVLLTVPHWNSTYFSISKVTTCVIRSLKHLRLVLDIIHVLYVFSLNCIFFLWSGYSGTETLFYQLVGIWYCCGWSLVRIITNVTKNSREITKLINISLHFSVGPQHPEWSFSVPGMFHPSAL